MSWICELTEDAQKDLRSLPRNVQALVARVLDQMTTDPFQSGVKSLHGKEWHGIFRRRIGSYRLLFEDADFGEASQAWLAHPSAKRNEAADPLREPCEHFRWSGPRDRGFCGYTHRESPLGIMINVCRRDEHLLDTVAEECFHMNQDIKYGSGWRAQAGYDAVEGEAREFVRLKAGEISSFCLDYGKRFPESSPVLPNH